MLVNPHRCLCLLLEIYGNSWKLGQETQRREGLAGYYFGINILLKLLDKWRRGEGITVAL